MDFVPEAMERPFTSARSLSVDVFRKVKELWRLRTVNKEV